MNFGQNLFTWFLTNAQPIVLLGLVIIGVILILKREMTKMIGFLIFAVIAVLLVFNTNGVQRVLLELGNRILGT